MGIFGQNTGKTITKREQCTSKGAIYRGNPHFQPFFNHRTRSRTAIPSPRDYYRAISTAIHHHTRTVLRTHAHRTDARTTSLHSYSTYMARSCKSTL